MGLSAVCAYNLSTAEAVFSGGKYMQSATVEQSHTKWVRYNGAVPTPRPGAVSGAGLREAGGKLVGTAMHPGPGQGGGGPGGEEASTGARKVSEHTPPPVLSSVVCRARGCRLNEKVALAGTGHLVALKSYDKKSSVSSSAPCTEIHNSLVTSCTSCPLTRVTFFPPKSSEFCVEVSVVTRPIWLHLLSLWLACGAGAWALPQDRVSSGGTRVPTMVGSLSAQVTK